MSKQTQKAVSGKTVRIWTEPKVRLTKVQEAKSKKERRPISEAELVSRAVDLFCDREEPKLGIGI